MNPEKIATAIQQSQQFNLFYNKVYNHQKLDGIYVYK
jgi:hypothetical protein